MLSNDNDCDKKKKNGIITGFLVGSAIGSVASLMLSTKKGRQTGKNLAQKAFDKIKKK